MHFSCKDAWAAIKVMRCMCASRLLLGSQGIVERGQCKEKSMLTQSMPLLLLLSGAGMCAA
eukprot:8704699-Lingulodinium_polyedra.AAC.1